ncbi:MAG TPA: HEAT repeat domain-containing protein [Kofleriaceae bacterium]|nr:HEAT repeat domain-containing protein [Kofleriaceae bacterium]
MRPVLLVAVLGALFGGCKKSPPAPPAPPQIVDVKVVDKTPDGQVGLDLAALTGRALTVIGQSSGMAVSDGGTPKGPRYKLRVEVRTEGAEDVRGGKGIMRALVSARLTPIGAEVGALGFEQAAVAERTYEIATRGDPGKAWQAHALRAVEDVVRGAGARARLSTSDASGLVAAIDGADEDLREEAIRLAGERKETSAVPSLIKLLKSEDHATRDRAIGALSTIGDPRAVKPLTEVARFRDHSDLPKVLDALAAIGGEESRAYLEFVASGHDNQEIRDLAKQSLTHLERRLKARDVAAAQR